MKIDLGRLLLQAVLVLMVGCGAVESKVTPSSDSPQESSGEFSLRPDATRPASAVIQLFNWPFKQIQSELCALRADGYSHVHVSPPQLSNGGPWWGRYQPLDLRVISGPLGTEAEFRAMTQEATRCKIDIIVDVVLNHAANLGLDAGNLFYPQNCDRSASPGSTPAACLWTPQDFHQAQCIGDYGNHCAVLYGRICGGGGDQGLPDLATGFCEQGGRLDIASRNYSPRVLRVAQDYVKKLLALGAKGIRLDAAKHMHPAFIEDLLSAPGIAGKAYAYAEVIADRNADPSLSAYRHLSALDFMDFPLTRTLMDSFAFGGSLRNLRSAQSNGRALDGASSVSFVTNHDVWGNDSGLGYRFSNFQDELLSHLYILGKADGLPYVYSELAVDSQSARFRGPQETYVQFHKRNEVQQMVRFHAAQIGKSQRWAWEDDVHLAFARGTNAFVAINKSGDAWSLNGIDLLLENGTYEDVFSGQRVVVRNGRANATVPARFGVMWVRIGA
jgi:alpha-amylase